MPGKIFNNYVGCVAYLPSHWGVRQIVARRTLYFGVPSTCDPGAQVANIDRPRAEEAAMDPNGVPGQRGGWTAASGRMRRGAGKLMEPLASGSIVFPPELEIQIPFQTRCHLRPALAELDQIAHRHPHVYSHRRPTLSPGEGKLLEGLVRKRLNNCLRSEST